MDKTEVSQERTGYFKMEDTLFYPLIHSDFLLDKQRLYFFLWRKVKNYKKPNHYPGPKDIMKEFRWSRTYADKLISQLKKDNLLTSEVRQKKHIYIPVALKEDKKFANKTNQPEKSYLRGKKSLTESVRKSNNILPQREEKSYLRGKKSLTLEVRNEDISTEPKLSPIQALREKRKSSNTSFKTSFKTSSYEKEEKNKNEKKKKNDDDDGSKKLKDKDELYFKEGDKEYQDSLREQREDPNYSIVDDIRKQCRECGIKNSSKLLILYSLRTLLNELFKAKALGKSNIDLK